MKNYALLSFLTWLLASTVGAQDESPQKPKAPEAIEGAWELENDDGSKRIKLIAGGQWAITQYDPESGAVVFHHGGTYTLNGTTYTETIVFANENTLGMKGDSHQFEVSVEGDILRQRGIGNPWNEDWQRIQAP